MSRPRIRTVKPEFFQDEKVVGLPITGRYIALGLITLADDRGRQRYTPPSILGHVFPTGDVKLPAVERFLEQIAAAGFARAYDSGPFTYLWLPNFWRHQVINKPTESELPPHPDDRYASLPIKEAITAFRSESSGSESGSTSGSSPSTSPVDLPPSRAGARSVPFLREEQRGLEPPEASDAPACALDRVFAAWQTSTGKTKAMLDAKRRKIIGARLRTWPEADLVDAVRGWRHSPHNRGENERGEVYNDIELLLRDAQHIEKFRDLERGVTPKSKPIGRKQLRSSPTTLTPEQETRLAQRATRLDAEERGAAA